MDNEPELSHGVQCYGFSRKPDQFRLDPAQSCAPRRRCDRVPSVYSVSVYISVIGCHQCTSVYSVHQCDRVPSVYISVHQCDRVPSVYYLALGKFSGISRHLEGDVIGCHRCTTSHSGSSPVSPDMRTTIRLIPAIIQSATSISAPPNPQ